jgi:hypothetical protein
VSAPDTISDLDIALSDSPYSITVGAVTKACIFVEGDSVALALERGGHFGGAGGQIAGHAVATVRTDAFPAIKGNDACTVSDGTTPRNFTVWRRLRIQDGAVTELILKAA